MKRKSENAIYTRLREVVFALRRNRKCDDRHPARNSHFTNLAYGFEGALRAGLEAGRRQKIFWRKNHEIKFFAASFVSEFVNAGCPRRVNTGAVIAEVENHYFNKIRNVAIRIAN